MIPLWSRTPGWVASGATLDMDFTNGLYYPSALSSLLTTTRASTGYGQTASGSLTSFLANASRITSLGDTVEPAATNVLLRSQDYSATWANTGSGVTQTAAQATAPDGTLTGTLISPGTGNITHGFFQSFTYTAAAYTFSVVLKAGAYSYVTLDFTNGGSSGATFDLSNGTIGFSDTGVTATVTNLTGGWYRCSITKTLTAVAGFPEFYLSSSRTTNGKSWTTTGAETFYVWGSQLELGSFATSYIPTTTVAVTRAADSAVVTIGNVTRIVYKFSDGTTQTISGTTPNSPYTIPTNLNKPVIARLTGYPS